MLTVRENYFLPSSISFQCGRMLPLYLAYRLATSIVFIVFAIYACTQVSLKEILLYLTNWSFFLLMVGCVLQTACVVVHMYRSSYSISGRYAPFPIASSVNMKANSLHSSVQFRLSMGQLCHHPCHLFSDLHCTSFYSLIVQCRGSDNDECL